MENQSLHEETNFDFIDCLSIYFPTRSVTLLKIYCITNSDGRETRAVIYVSDIWVSCWIPQMFTRVNHILHKFLTNWNDDDYSVPAEIKFQAILQRNERLMLPVIFLCLHKLDNFVSHCSTHCHWKLWIKSIELRETFVHHFLENRFHIVTIEWISRLQTVRVLKAHRRSLVLICHCAPVSPSSHLNRLT